MFLKDLENNRISPYNIEKLERNQVFVFSSNIQGIHGTGTAKKAMEFGAFFCKGVGFYGQTYAIPTKSYKNGELFILAISEISAYIKDFIRFAKKNPKLIFLVTEIGCGFDKYSPKEIAPLFKGAEKLTNIFLPERFLYYLIKQTS